MSSSKHRIAALFLPVLLALATVGAMGDGVAAQPGDGASQVLVGIYVVGLGNFDANKGTYNLDFYLWLTWDATGGDVTPLTFEFMNGRATSKEKLSDETDQASGQRNVWYRVNAALFHQPEFAKYPFNKQQLTIEMEDTLWPSGTLVYVPSEGDSGHDDKLSVAGWSIEDWDLHVGANEYPWGESYSRLTFTISIGHPTTTTALKTLLPPIIFCIVSGLSFAFRPDKVTNRIGFGTSMLISAVMFHISQTSSLPPMPSLMTIDKIMIATYSFLAASLFVTTLIYIDEEYWKERDYTKKVNLYGAVLSIVLPFVVYGLLNL